MKKFFIYFITLLSLILVGMLLFSQALTVGLKFRSVHPYLEITFYIISILLFYVLILHPLMTVLFAKYYSVAKYCDDEGSNSKIYLRANRLIKNNAVSEQEQVVIGQLITNKEKEKLSKKLFIIYNNELKESIDKLVVSSAKDAMFITAVSQSRFIDSLSILSINFRMIKKIVVLCGFRPTFLRLCKLYANVFIATLAADGLSKLDTSALISSSIKGFGKVLTNSATSGAVNALFVLRIGMLTKHYLYASDVKKEKFSIRNNSFTNAVSLFPNVITSLVTSPIKSVASLFKNKNDEVDLIEDSDEVNEEELPKVKWTHRKK